MPSRAQYLAKILTERARDRAEANGRDQPTEADVTQIVEKVLAIEEGIVDSVKVKTVSAALPRTGQPTTRELAELAAFLDRYLSPGA